MKAKRIGKLALWLAGLGAGVLVGVKTYQVGMEQWTKANAPEVAGPPMPTAEELKSGKPAAEEDTGSRLIPTISDLVYGPPKPEVEDPLTQLSQAQLISRIHAAEAAKLADTKTIEELKTERDAARVQEKAATKLLKNFVERATKAEKALAEMIATENNGLSSEALKQLMKYRDAHPPKTESATPMQSAQNPAAKNVTGEDFIDLAPGN